MNATIAKLLYEWHAETNAPLEVRSYVQQMADYLAPKIVSMVASTLEQEAYSMGFDPVPGSYSRGYVDGTYDAAKIIRDRHKAEPSK